MPFIEEERRILFDPKLNQILKIDKKGDLEYCIYKLMKLYMKDKKFCYSNLHDAVYSAIHAGDEFKRNHLDKREDKAKEENGDIK